MARRPQHKKKKLPAGLVELTINALTHDGRGVARREGKTQFVEGALVGETVRARYTDTRSKFDELVAEEILVASEDRLTPPCPHASLCGGCSLQYIDSEAQIRFKQTVLQGQFRHFGDITVESFLPPMTGPSSGYRRKARLGVRYVGKCDEMLLGFREKRSSSITNINQCLVMDDRIAKHIDALRAVIRSLSVFRAITHVEVAAGDAEVALVFRHMSPLNNEDIDKLIAFGDSHYFHIYLQPQDAGSTYRIHPKTGEERLTYRLDDFDLNMKFHPLDFTQVNADINHQMVSRAVDWLQVNSEDRVLDLFCGLGNFTLPLARKAREVVGVEGTEAMVLRGRENAEYNDLRNVKFYGADLQADFTQSEWAKEGFDKLLIDPPRSGALDMVRYLPKFGAKKIVYVSCNPATLSRDAGVLVEHGYRMVKAGVMDMFPHTTHVESIALFEK
ncbi:23S rRNA (uracil(1939)-C(5))-methyltransferase RlmD [Alkalimarinus alittae]|uniref:23S rRNA (uracil(1939)-C(5))-methyltransferase RlmD n=1 Tax=Alkalimarinus alittae TaxID=2961619 RepID=A0ABY6N4V8_9ALTE|nr:23S rRNA (uracil(1939)-C(5))-methyltransferase RlmD [Alkalimarinus alittae]UZE97126.1 23S rRNA (uracil(1939)-C(5))-methyltransferase RlmD [Alkalimarinus alittae]